MTAPSSVQRARRATPPARSDPVLVLVLDHAHARFFRVRGSRVREVECLVSPRMRGGKFHSDRQGSPGWGEGGFHGRRREEERRHYAGVARKLGALVRASGARGVVLGGPRRVVVELRGALPAALAPVVWGTAPLNATAVTEDAVREAARIGRRAAEAGAERAAVAALLEGFGAERAVEGVRPVLQALERNQVRLLLVDPEYVSRAFRGSRSGRLVLSKADAAGEPVTGVANLVEAAAEAARRHGADVVEVHDRRLAGRFDKLGALLRYR